MGVANSVISAFRNLEGPQDIGRGPGFWFAVSAVIVMAAFIPWFASAYQLLNLSNYMISVFLALGLCLIWGYTGILSLGQAAFSGLGGYIYGVIGINFIESHGNTDLAVVGGLLGPVLVAAFLGYVMFYARIQGVYVAILMLVVTMLIQAFLNQTAGEHWSIGIAHLGGNNGLGRFSAEIRDPPTLAIGVGEQVVEFAGQTAQFFYLVLVLLVMSYLGLRMLVNSGLGYVMVAIRENPDRTETFGYDIRLIQTCIFCLSALLSAMSGILYVSWGNFITPDVFSVANNVLPVIWVAVGGRKSLTATVISTLFLVWLSQWLALRGDFALIILGAVLVGSMTVVPEGIITGVLATIKRWRAMNAVRRGESFSSVPRREAK